MLIFKTRGLHGHTYLTVILPFFPLAAGAIVHCVSKHDIEDSDLNDLLLAHRRFLEGAFTDVVEILFSTWL